jgi:cell division transport system permease protein
MRTVWSAWRFVLNSSLQNFRRNLGVSLAGVTTMGLILLLVGTLAMGTYLLTNVLHDQELRTSKLKIYIADGASLADVVNFQHRLQQDPRVQDVSYENKDAAFADAQSKGTDIATAISALGSNPLPASLNVDVKQLRYLSQINDIARASPLTDQTQPTDYNPDVTSKIQAIITWTTIIVGVVAAMLLAVSVVIIMNTIRTAVYARRTEIEIMKLVGATDWFVRWPFILEGVIGGLLGAVLASIIVFIGYRLTVAVTAGGLFAIPFNGALTVVVLAGLFGGGGLIGAVGSYFGVRRFLGV